MKEDGTPEYVTPELAEQWIRELAEAFRVELDLETGEARIVDDSSEGK